jgi:hypothetical protein
VNGHQQDVEIGEVDDFRIEVSALGPVDDACEKKTGNQEEIGHAKGLGESHQGSQ